MFRSIDLSSTDFKDRKNHFYEIMIYELPEPPAKAVFCFIVERKNECDIINIGNSVMPWCNGVFLESNQR